MIFKCFFDRISELDLKSLSIAVYHSASDGEYPFSEKHIPNSLTKLTIHTKIKFTRVLSNVTHLKFNGHNLLNDLKDNITLNSNTFPNVRYIMPSLSQQGISCDAELIELLRERFPKAEIKVFYEY
jgi:hypothetical protein